MLVLMLGGVDDNLPDFSHSFLGDHGWKDLDEYLGQDEGYSAERYRNQRETVVSKKDGKIYKLWVGISQEVRTMQLLDEDKLAQFVRSIVIEMKPELKSDINKDDVKRMIESSSREWLNAKQSANYLGVSVVTFREWRRKYKIPS